MFEKLGTLKDFTPVKALVKPHKTVQLPIYKEGLPELADEWHHRNLQQAYLLTLLSIWILLIGHWYQEMQYDAPCSRVVEPGNKKQKEWREQLHIVCLESVRKKALLSGVQITADMKVFLHSFQPRSRNTTSLFANRKVSNWIKQSKIKEHTSM